MKKKLLALVCALVMIFSLASCGLSTPDTVGKVGDFEVSSGLYLLAQFSAYQQAAQLVGTDQDATDVKAFLKETITTDADSGETAVVQDYVADKTLETLRTFAAIDARFAELGGELTAEQTQVADNYAQQLMDQYGSTYTANGIGLETLKAFERIQLKHTLLLTLVYGPDGESPVDDSDLTEHLDSQMYELAYVNIPLYNTSTFVSASDDQKAQMLQLAQIGRRVLSRSNAGRLGVRAGQCPAFCRFCRPAGHLRRAGLHPRRRCFQRADRTADRKRPDRCLYPGRCRRRRARPCVRRGRCRAVQCRFHHPDDAH